MDLKTIMSRWMFIVLCMTSQPGALAETRSLNGGDLLSICEDALINGYRHPEGMACYWYITPCDCNYGTVDLPRVCLPADLDETGLTSMVIDGLKSRPELLSLPAAEAANTILSKHYPCHNDNVE
ncbi:MAG: hypothetical protein MI673_04780 [Thiotrichales bacterium]|nr:hypothetical protein [Thiotrichales bacterium]